MKAQIRGYCIIIDREPEEGTVRVYIPFNRIESFTIADKEVFIVTPVESYKLNFSTQRTADDFVNRLSQQMRYCALGSPCA